MNVHVADPQRVCRKLAFATPEEADAELDRCRYKREVLGEHWRQEKRRYPCWCGFWHLSCRPEQGWKP